VTYGGGFSTWRGPVFRDEASIAGIPQTTVNISFGVMKTERYEMRVLALVIVGF